MHAIAISGSPRKQGNILRFADNLAWLAGRLA
jgi:hypothetical protein